MVVVEVDCVEGDFSSIISYVLYMAIWGFFEKNATICKICRQIRVRVLISLHFYDFCWIFAGRAGKWYYVLFTKRATI